MSQASQIHFLLNGNRESLSDIRPDETLLDFLRLKRRLRGTKEGCAEGDCGACTVLVGRIKNGGLRYESVNACIRFLGTLNACHVVTIEDLADEDGGLNVLQQAMVTHHASQCGFCTPGIVMSLFALLMENDNPSRQAIEKSLQGNLCRCTGYQPIIDAVLAISGSGNSLAHRLQQQRQSIEAELKQMTPNRRIEIGSGRDRLIVPHSRDDFENALSENPDATIVAGSTDVGLWVTKHFAEIAPAIFINQLDEMAEITFEEGVIKIGATASYTDAFEVLSETIPTMRRYWNRIGGEQVRNMGTIGGNIANGSPIGDTPPPLIALGATLHLAGNNKRRSIPLEDFFIEYGKQDLRKGEFVDAVEVPVPLPDQQFAVYKISKRQDEDISALVGAFKLHLNEDNTVNRIRICFGGMAGTPKRAADCEQFLIGKHWDISTIEQAFKYLEQDFQPLSDWRASSEYRMLTAKNLLKRFFMESQTHKQTKQLFSIDDLLGAA